MNFFIINFNSLIFYYLMEFLSLLFKNVMYKHVLSENKNKKLELKKNFFI